MHRRTVLARLASAGALGTAGCSDMALPEPLASQPSPAVAWRARGEGRWARDVVAGDDHLFVLAHLGGITAVERDSGAIAWVSDTGLGDTVITLLDRTVYAGTREAVQAIDADSGALRWRTDLPMPSWTGHAHTPTAEGVYFVRGGGTVVGKLDPDTGDREWSVEREAPEDTGNPVGNPVVTDGRVIVGTWSSAFAVDATDGSDVWTVERSAPTTPAILDDRVVACGGSEVFSLDAASGEERWSFELEPGGMPRDPLFVDGVVVCANYESAVFGLEPETGEPLWSVDPGSTVATAPITDGETVYVTTGDDDVYALDPGSGERRWVHDDSEFDASNPPLQSGSAVVVDDRLHVPGYETPVFDIDEGERVGTLDHAAFYRPPEAYQGTLIAPTSDGFVYGYDTETGRERWRFSRDAPISFGAVARGDDLVYANGEDTLFALDPSDGRLVWSVDVDGSLSSRPLAVVDGTVVVEGGDHRDRRIYGVDASGGTESWTIDSLSWVRDLAPGTGSVYVRDRDRLVALDPDDGSEIWNTDLDRDESGPSAEPQIAVAADRVVISHGSALRAFDAADGANLWDYGAERDLRRPAVNDDRVFTADVHDPSGEPDSPERVYAVDLASGEEQWRESFDAEVKAPAVADGSLFVTSIEQSLHVLDPETGDRLERFEDPSIGRGPAFVHGSRAVFDGRGLLGIEF